MAKKHHSKKVEEKERARKGRLFFTGFSMGIADLVPGVSGGTVAFLYGIYDELLYSVKIVTGKFPRLLLSRQFKEAISIVPFGFLLPLFVGIFAAVFGLVGIFTFLLENYAVYVWSVFFGLVLGSAYVVSKRVTVWNWRRVMLLLIGLAATYVFVGIPVISTSEPTFLVLALIGAIASCAMILPGISGSLILVILGQYEYVIGAVSERRVGTLITFAFGAVAGLAAFSRLLSWLLHRHHSAVVAFLVGVMIGSLRKVWPWQLEQGADSYSNVWPQFSGSFVMCLLLMVIGYLIVWKLEKLGITKDHTDIDDKDFVKEVRTQHD